MEMSNELIIQLIKKLYKKYGVDAKFIDLLEDDKKSRA